MTIGALIILFTLLIPWAGMQMLVNGCREANWVDIVAGVTFTLLYVGLIIFVIHLVKAIIHMHLLG